MKVQFYGKNLNLRSNTKEEIDKKLERLNKYFHDSVEAKVSAAQEGDGMRVEITIPLPKSDTILRADRHAEDLMDAVDQCVGALVSQIRKYKTKLERRRYAQDSIRFAEIEAPEQDQELPAVYIARVKELEVQSMSPEEAVDQMELLGHDFFLFYHQEVEKICLVYKRHAGNYGLLIPTHE